MRSPVRIAAILLLVLSCRAFASGGELESGFALLDEAARMRLSDPERSARVASDAAVLIGSSLDADAELNPAAQRALGNAWLLSGDVGRAVLAFKRAEAVSPGDPMVRSSLEHARSLVGVDFGSGAGGDSRWRTVLNDWRARVPRAAVFYGGVALLFVGCGVLAMRIVSVLPKWVTVPAAVAAGIGACALALLVAEPMMEQSGAAVVVSETTGRTGPHEQIYPPALDRAVPAGAEVRVLGARDGWYLCALGGEKAWLPGESVERVRPSDQGATTGG